MPIRFSYNQEHSFIRTVISDSVDDNDLLSYYRELYNDPHYQEGANELVVAENLETINVNTSTILHTCRQSNEAAFQMPSRRIALVPKTPLQYGYVRMYDNLTIDSPWEKAIFDSEEDAVAWLTDGKEESSD